jgi:dipeptide transport system substrate-binding protein
LCEDEPENCATINPHYHALEDVQIASISLVPTLDSEVALEGYKSGELDFIQIYPRDVDLASDYPDLMNEIQPFIDYEILGLGFNTSKPPLDNVLVRQALAHSIDREMLIATSNEPWNMPATTLTPPIMAPQEKLATELNWNLDLMT